MGRGAKEMQKSGSHDTFRAAIRTLLLFQERTSKLLDEVTQYDLRFNHMALQTGS